MNPVWERRLKRTADLAATRPAARPVLRFFRAVTSFQQDLDHRLSTHDAPDSRRLDTSYFADFLPAFLDLVERTAPIEIAQLAGRFRSHPEEEWEELLRATWQGTAIRPGARPLEFIPRAMLQPLFMRRAREWREADGPLDGSNGTCPFCGRPPRVAVQAGPRRTLACGLCATEWEAPWRRCPACQEIRPERLPRHVSDAMPWMRIEACTTCGSFVKGVDLDRNPDAEPLVDDVAAADLDSLARRLGFTRSEANAVGV